LENRNKRKAERDLRIQENLDTKKSCQRWGSQEEGGRYEEEKRRARSKEARSWQEERREKIGAGS
jgi:hypothetical protein